MRTKVFSVLIVVFLLGLVLPARTQGQRGQPVQLPEGAGQEMVQGSCTGCHRLNLIANSPGYTREGWEKLFSSMVALPGDEANVVATYLATNFPVQPAPEAVVIPGPVEVSITEWLAPSLGSRPHDPLAAADGSLWWTGQWSSRLGRVDPETGAIKEFPLPDDSGPHGLTEDADGNVWFTGISQNYIGKLDPNTGDVTRYPVPEAAVAPNGARGPHTPIFDQSGTLWFTLQSGMVGRLIPSTGEMRIVATPSDNTYPYGIQVNSEGVPWYVDFRGNRVGSIDPETMEITEYTLPESRCPSQAPRSYSGRRGVVYGLRTRLSGTVRSCHRRGPRMALAQWSPVPALWHRHRGYHRLVQRIGSQRRHARAFRHRNGGVSDVVDPVWRGRRPQHDGDGGWRPGVGM